MTDIPRDIMEAALNAVPVGCNPRPLALAILAERARCAKVARSFAIAGAAPASCLGMPVPATAIIADKIATAIMGGEEAIDLFGNRPRRPRRVMMHAVDTGDALGLCGGWRTTAGARFVCSRCGRDDGWSFDLTASELRRGLPCPDCNGSGADG